MAKLAVSSNSKPGYHPTPHILAFVDALGFLKEIATTSAKRIDHFFKIVERAKDWCLKREGKGAQLKVITIGDSAILAMKVNATKNVGGKLVGDDQSQAIYTTYYIP